LDVLRDVPDVTPPTGPAFTLVETHLLAGIAHLQLGDRRAAAAAAETALAAAEPDRLIFPFALTEAAELLDALPRHETAHGALLADIVDLLRGAPAPNTDRERLSQREELSPSELRVLRYLPTNLTRPEIARELYVSINTANTHIRNIYSKLGARDRSSAVHVHGSCGSSRPGARERRRASEHRRTHDHQIPASPAHYGGLQDDRVATPPGLYVIRIKGRLGATALSAFPSMVAELKGSDTVLTGVLEDRSALFGVVAQIEALGLELLELRQIRAQPAAREPGDDRPSPGV
jgi:DNA-binding CsgD family transcriptional regulator